MQESWKVARSAPHCADCSAEFPGGQMFYSALCEDAEDFVRLDYCDACWQRTDRARFFSFWKTCRRESKRPARIDLDVVMDLFAKLAESDRADRVEMRFVVALYLARRKALKLTGVRREGDRELIQFRRPRHDDVILVEDPHLNEEQIAAATERLKELFQAEL